MGAKKKLWQNLNLHSEMNPEFTLNDHVELFIEQVVIERKAFMQEISDLRLLLQQNHIDAEAIKTGLERSDLVLDKLLRYQQGKCGKLVKKGIHIMPYRWRRKVRNALM
ncbi:hypothetical protein ACVEIO_023970 (plasmid) [Klebsiella aerogenes]